MRQRRKLTQAALAEKLLTHQTVVARWETGWSASRSSVQRIMNALDCTEAELKKKGKNSGA
jgi:DNA-binding transcriptional regulator YiaG